MAHETPAGIRAMEELERVVTAAGYPADDPGLRERFPDLPRAPIRVICCPLDKGINHGNILRISDCFRVESVCFAPVGRRKERDFSGGFAALKWQPYRWIEPTEAVAEAKSDGLTVYGLALSPNAVPLRSVRWSHPAAIVLGRELEGIDDEVAAMCDAFVGIPLYGLIQSLNVAVSAALAVESCLAAYVAEHPEFEPARSLSRTLISPQT
jgi:23S rRNA (guanosine2251-2'-O)-methyltransferase